MPNNVRVTFGFYNATSARSWTETLYHSDNVTLQKALRDAVTLAPLRMACAGESIQMFKIRVSSDDQKGDSLIDTKVRLGSAPGGFAGDFPCTCLKVRFDGNVANGTAHRTALWYGFPVNMTAFTNEPAITPIITANINNAWNALKLALGPLQPSGQGGLWGFSHQGALGGQTPGWVNAAITVAAGVITVTTVLQNNCVQGGKVKISGTTLATGKTLDGVYPVYATPTPNQFKILNALVGTGPWTRLGFSLGIGKSTVLFTNITPLGFTSRQRGVSFGGARGRKRSQHRVGS